MIVQSEFHNNHTASAQNPATCTGLDQLIQNSNSALLSNCAKDSACTRVSCSVAGTLGSYLGSAIFTLSSPCGAPPGVRFQLLPLVDQIITSPTTISRSLSGLATATISVFVNSTTSTVGISVNIRMQLITMSLSLKLHNINVCLG
jgi:hypothetical protein